MKKSLLMLIAFAAVFAIGTACFGPSSKADKDSPAYRSTNAPATSR